MPDQLTLIEFPFVILQPCFGIKGESNRNKHCFIGKIPQDEAATEIHFIQIAAGGVNRIIAPAGEHNDLFLHHLNLISFSQSRSLPAAPEYSGIAETTYEDKKQQTESQQLFHTNTSMLKLTISQVIYHIPLAVTTVDYRFSINSR
jgi:hypothetical protein